MLKIIIQESRFYFLTCVLVYGREIMKTSKSIAQEYCPVFKFDLRFAYFKTKKQFLYLPFFHLHVQTDGQDWNCALY